MEFGKDIMSVGFYLETNGLFEGQKKLRIYHVISVVLCTFSQLAFALMTAKLYHIDFFAIFNINI